MSKKTWALLAAFLVALIYSANYSIAKDVMPHHVQPFGFIIFRVAGAMILFWLVGLLGPKEKIERSDYPNVLIGAIFGMAVNMLAFFEGLNLTTPINAAVVMVTAPLVVLPLSFVFLKEKMNLKKVLGVLIGMSGTLLIIFYGKGQSLRAPNPALGNFLIFINASSYAIYIIAAKKLTQKYHPFTFIKWMYTIGLVVVLPFGWEQVSEMNFDTIPMDGYLKIGYVVVFSTFGTYILNIFAIKELKPTTVAVFIYLQPLLATAIAIGLGSDVLDYVKIGAALLIFAGVYLVTKTPLAKK